jgi:hypothetical protein
VYIQKLEPVADSLGFSALVATLPLVIVLVLLGGVRMKAHRAGLIGLPAASLVAWLAYGCRWARRSPVPPREPSSVSSPSCGSSSTPCGCTG